MSRDEVTKALEILRRLSRDAIIKALVVIDLPDLLDQVPSQPEADRNHRLCEALINRGQLTRFLRALEGSPTPAVHLPQCVPNRIDRANVQRALTESFEAEQRQVCIYGGSGVGKSSVAVLWAHDNRREFDGGIYFTASAGRTTNTVEAVWAAIEGQLGLETPGTDVDRARAALEHLDARTQRTLVIIDDLNPEPGDHASTTWPADVDLRGLRSSLPTSGAVFVLATSRAKLDDRWKSVECETLTRDESERLLRNTIQSSVQFDEPSFQILREILHEDLDGHALGVRLLGIWLREDGGDTSAESLRTRLRADLGTLQEYADAAGLPHAHEHPLPASLALHRSLLLPGKPVDDNALRMLSAVSLLAANQPVDHDTLFELMAATDGWDEKTAKDARQRLLSLSTLTRPAGRTVQIHPMLADFERRHHPASDAFKRALADAAASKVPWSRKDLVEPSETLGILPAHLGALANMDAPPSARANVCRAWGDRRFIDGHHEEAIKAFAISVEGYEQRSPRFDLCRRKALHKKAYALMYVGSYEETLACTDMALDGLEESPETEELRITTLDLRGHAYTRLSQLDHALDAHQTANRLCRAAHEREACPDSARSLGISLYWLGHVHTQRDELELALTCHEEGLTLYEGLLETSSKLHLRREMLSHKSAIGKLRDDLTMLEQVCEETDHIVDEEPRMYRWRRDAVVARLRLAAALTDRGRHEESVRWSTEAVGIVRDIGGAADSPTTRLILAECNAELARAMAPTDSAAARKHLDEAQRQQRQLPAPLAQHRTLCKRLQRARDALAC